MSLVIRDKLFRLRLEHGVPHRHVDAPQLVRQLQPLRYLLAIHKRLAPEHLRLHVFVLLLDSMESEAELLGVVVIVH